MRVVALEEHFMLKSLVDQHFDVAGNNPGYSAARDAALADLGELRLADMDKFGVTMQVISASMPGADMIDGPAGIDFARRTNDRLAAAVRAHPARFAGFAHLPMRVPEAAADELDRAVSDLGFRGAMINGMTNGLFLDDPQFAPILARAVALDVPIYIHPNLPPKAVREIYYDRLPTRKAALLASGVFGWHSEVGIHVLRLALAGSFEQFPSLRIIVGHMGEMLPFMLGRADDALTMNGETAISETVVEHVYITTSGMFTTAPFLTALSTFGADRIMFSVDYPYSLNVQGQRFLEDLPVSHIDKAKIAHGNADALLKLKV